MTKSANKIFLTVTLFKKAYGRYKAQILILTSISLFVGIMEGIGINAIIPLFAFISNNQFPATDKISALIKNLFTFFHLPYSLKSILIFIPVLFTFKFIASFLFYFLKMKIVSNYEKKTRGELFKKTLAAKWSYLLNQKTGYLEKTIMVDTTNATNLLSYVTELILVGVSLLIYTVVAINISITITLLTLTVGASIFLIFKPLIYQTRVLAKKETETMKDAAAFINENAYGMKTIKSLPDQDGIIEKSNNFFKIFRGLYVKKMLLIEFTSDTIQLMSIFFILGIFVLFYTTSEFNFASFAVIIYLVQKMFAYVQSGQNKLHNINTFIPYLENVIKYNEILEIEFETNKGGKEFSLNNTLSINNVEFKYNNNKKVLNNINFEIKKGEMVGIIGPSGAGKTTLVDLLLRLFKPTNGEIKLDNINIEAVELTSWRKNIGYVSQDIFLINDTIKNNIKFYNQDLTNDDVIQAARDAQIYDFIVSLPDQFDSIIGERGIMLSGGQRQRIILARTLARKPAILILDEATSALDNESEVLIQKSIEGLKGKTTVIAIAHRLSTVKNSDRLIVLDNGNIVEMGNPDELLKNKNSYYYKVFNIRNDDQT
ncbi:MAG: ABC transporter ATP-binding protein [Patescibacteria group bacterium]|nr:ABC transporter ATP-binding protein [Patescibacteria group bacterium]